MQYITCSFYSLICLHVVCRVDIYSSSLSNAELTSSLLLDVHMFVCILNCSSVNQIFVDFAFKVLNDWVIIRLLDYNYGI